MLNILRLVLRMLSGAHHQDVAPARAKLPLAIVWAAAFVVGMTADIRLQDSVILFDGNLEHAIQDHHVAALNDPSANSQSPSAA